MKQISTQKMNVVEQTVWEAMQSGESFTSLDISNNLKRQRFPMKHRESAEIIRMIYDTGAMNSCGYLRELIHVQADGRQEVATTWLYRHESVDPNEYQNRDQIALPPVPKELARDMDDCVSAFPLGLLVLPADYDEAPIYRTNNDTEFFDLSVDNPRFPYSR